MKSAHWIIVAAVLAVAAVAAWLSISEPAPEAAPPLFPELTFDALDEAERIEIGTSDTPVVSVYRDGGAWRVAERHDHPADVLKIRRLLSDLKDARKLERKTSSPEYYARLGVADPGGDGGGKLLMFKDAHETRRLIVGKSSRQVSGQYVRAADEEVSWLIDVNLQLPTDPGEWLDTQIVHIEPSEVMTVTLTHPDDEESFTVTRGADGTLGLSDLPQGRVLGSRFLLRQIVAATDYLEFRRVFLRADHSVELPDKHITAQVTASDQLELTLNAYKTDDGDAYLTLGAGGAGERADALKPHLSKWLYEVSPTVYDNLDKRRDDLVEDAPEAQVEAEAEVGAEAEAKPESGSVPEIKIEAKVEPGLETAPEAEVGSEAGAEPGLETAPEAEVESGSEAASEAESK